MSCKCSFPLKCVAKTKDSRTNFCMLLSFFGKHNTKTALSEIIWSAEESTYSRLQMCQGLKNENRHQLLIYIQLFSPNLKSFWCSWHFLTTLILPLAVLWKQSTFQSSWAPRVTVFYAAPVCWGLEHRLRVQMLLQTAADTGLGPVLPHSLLAPETLAQPIMKHPWVNECLCKVTSECDFRLCTCKG